MKLSVELFLRPAPYPLRDSLFYFLRIILLAGQTETEWAWTNMLQTHCLNDKLKISMMNTYIVRSPLKTILT